MIPITRIGDIKIANKKNSMNRIISNCILSIILYIISIIVDIEIIGFGFITLIGIISASILLIYTYFENKKIDASKIIKIIPILIIIILWALLPFISSYI